MKKVLVIDDEAVIVEVLCRHLARIGYEASGAGSAEEALTFLDRDTADVILLDNVLPGMTGLKALAEIRSRSSAPVIIMTGHCDDELRKDAFLLGASGLLSKPHDLAILDELLRKTLEAHS
ncbi:MAG TPA: response regulator [Elusimicrobia bacterium]|nr:response regulator [Elusimicrobiota bacterium]HBT60609.1 response regulator [Elusimicrobiota bacterium]